MSPFAPDEDARARFASRWVRLGDPDPGTLRDARLQLHWALQLLSAFGDCFVPHRPDFSHSSVTWSPERRAFLSGQTVEGSSLRLGLEPGQFAYRLFGPETSRSGAFELRNRTRSEAAAWLREARPLRDNSADGCWQSALTSRWDSRSWSGLRRAVGRAGRGGAVVSRLLASSGSRVRGRGRRFPGAMLATPFRHRGADQPGRRF